MPTVNPGRRALILDAAAELFTARPFDEVTTSEVARRAGVAYGLVAHHFGSKRGLYLAVVEAAAERLRAVHEAPQADGPPAERLRDALTRHVAHIDAHARGFLALMRAGNGADAEVRALIERHQAAGAARLLAALGVREPHPPALRAAVRGWVTGWDAMLADRLEHRDVPAATVVALATATLVAALRAAHALDPVPGLDPRLLDRLIP
ncbi:TetR/AcrR family transcriptional regulator [Actinomadura parmotrematis]|uniref:TetR/AcrR family transcriptional regulator n=1 Tax=Actinomadura parmotrematis TaxID=2864039 RepID=A0ABS7FNL1_9ACTN|nr:TetR/AcrR family transcriptional regulator [Actinomadura parmotrematis]MBW8481972.1 TetR/AcrR family transcriptional regulator [Actinomadura parmotrematis]